MRRYEITYSGQCPQMRTAYEYEFCVKEGGRSFRVVVGTTDTVLSIVSNRAGQTEEELQAQLPQIIFKKLHAELLSKGIPASGDLLMTSYDPEVDNLVQVPNSASFWRNREGIICAWLLILRETTPKDLQRPACVWIARCQTLGLSVNT
ncbi:hypothetical protein [Candidatus Hakubella thermalkaliphila]|uniref:hypothetical protein n=1 Tax=Candidatus Hakubella thermalkaliphila TaxID=2754717 RepID=UPI001594BCD8|nr:hypothetical protein [Candidatus Hakubella thermalkaliphila]GFP41375.1 hypothetical protein HKBW3C_00501 [Candidatus Hakubella thermalkaliphila]